MIQSLLIATINIIIYVLAFHLTGIDLGDVVVERVPSVDRLPVLAFEASTLSRIDPLCVATHNRPLGSPFNRSWFPASVADPGQAFLGWADDNIGDPLCGEGYGPVPDFLGRGRDPGYPGPPARIPASGTTAQGSCLGSRRRTFAQAKGVGCGPWVARCQRGSSSVPR